MTLQRSLQPMTLVCLTDGGSRLRHAPPLEPIGSVSPDVFQCPARGRGDRTINQGCSLQPCLSRPWAWGQDGGCHLFSPPADVPPVGVGTGRQFFAPARKIKRPARGRGERADQ